MSFLQAAPHLPHPLHEDAVLREYLARALDAEALQHATADLEALAAWSLATFERRQQAPRDEPVFTPWGAWGERLDRLSLSRTWQEGPELTARHGLVAIGHEPRATARIEQFARVYVYHMASEFFTCPLAMSDGAAGALRAAGDAELNDRVLPHLLSRDEASLWLSGQWMTETIGGSDVRNTETLARRDDDGQWRLSGRKWFTSAIVGECALALAHPEGSDPGTLALFFVRTRDDTGRWQGLVIDRLKDKLGTRELPTAEIHLDGIPAWPVGELQGGVRRIAPMLGITRTWNSVCAVAHMARAIALARDYARRREAFGRPLAEHPAHRRTLADMQAEFEAAFHLVFAVTDLLGRVENGLASADEAAVLRLLTPLAKLWTGKLAVAIASEALECFGGNGYIEDTGIPQLLRDAQVYPIWEGTTNVLALDVLRVLGKTGATPLRRYLDALLGAGDDPLAEPIRHALAATVDWFAAQSEAPDVLQGNARGFAMSLARTLAAATLLQQVRWDAGQPADTGRSRAALRRFLAHGLSRLDVSDDGDVAALLQLS